MKLVTLLLLACLSFAQDKPSELAAKLKSSEATLRFVKLELAVEREQSLNKRLQEVQLEKQALAREICSGEGLKMEECSIDLATKTAVKIEPPKKIEEKK